MKSICILLNGGISNDARVIKTIQSLSKKLRVDLIYILPKETDKNLFNENVKLIPLNSSSSKWVQKINANIFFYKVYNFFFEYVKNNKIQYDYVWANDLPTLLPAVRIKGLNKEKTKLIYDAHEIYTETLNQFFNTNANLVKNTIFKLLIFVMRFLGSIKEKALIKEVDYFITVGDAVADYFVKNLNYPLPIIVKNCPYFLNNKSSSNLLQETFSLNKSDIVFLYQGVLNKGRALTMIVNAFLKTEEHVKLVVLGSGILEQELKSIVANNKTKNKVFFKSKVEYKDLFRYTASADFGVNYVEPLNQSKKLASPNKVFEYLQNEIPILMSNSVENTKINDLYSIGVCTKLNEQDILKGIKEIQKIDKSLLNNNIKEAKKVFNWETQEKILLSIFKN